MAHKRTPIVNSEDYYSELILLIKLNLYSHEYLQIVVMMMITGANPLNLTVVAAGAATHIATLGAGRGNQSHEPSHKVHEHAESSLEEVDVKHVPSTRLIVSTAHLIASHVVVTLATEQTRPGTHGVRYDLVLIDVDIELKEILP